MARRRKREERPPESNRGRRGARGVFLIFERDEGEGQEPAAESRPEPQTDADEPLTRDDGDDAR